MNEPKTSGVYCHSTCPYIDRKDNAICVAYSHPLAGIGHSSIGYDYYRRQECLDEFGIDHIANANKMVKTAENPV